MYNYNNIDDLLKQAAAILEHANYTILNNESFINLMQRGYANKETAINDLKEIIQKIEFNQDNDKGIIFNIKNNMLIVEKDNDNIQYWNSPSEDITEEVGEHFLYPGIEIEFKTGERNKVYFNRINITDKYISLNEFTTFVPKERNDIEERRKTPTSYPL